MGVGAGMNSKPEGANPQPKSNTKPRRAVVNVPLDEAPALDRQPYYVQSNQLWMKKQGKEGPYPVALANFSAQIKEEVVRDDGAEALNFLSIEGRAKNGAHLQRVEVPATQFASLNWVLNSWGNRAVIFAGMGSRDHLRAAIQILSPDTPRRVIYSHTGWRKLDGAWCYLHAGGAIGSCGPVASVEVDPGGKLQSYRLPDPPQGQSLRSAIQASMGLLDVAPDEISVPLFLACYRAPLGGAHFGLHLAGSTGRGKSVSQALMQAHWGGDWTFEHLPGSWQSTKTALEILTFAAKDAVLCIDDFAPDGTKLDQARLQGTMAHIFRSAGNGSSRDRAIDGGKSLQASRPPRCLVISSGEDLPAGHSIKARVLIVECSSDFLDWEKVTRLQAQGRDGILAASMAGYVQWLAPQMEGMAKRLDARLGELRSIFEASHKRSVDALCQLLMAGEHFLAFAQAAGAIHAQEAAALDARFKMALNTVGKAQAEAQALSDPVARFLEILPALFISGRAHLEGIHEDEPAHPDRLGWKHKNGAAPDVREPKGRMIGWEDDESGLLYLEPTATYAEVQAMAGQDGEAFPVSKGRLWKLLKEKGLIVPGRKDGNTCKAPGRAHQASCVALHGSSIGIPSPVACVGEVS
jgi:hypothetical protein